MANRFLVSSSLFARVSLQLVAFLIVGRVLGPGDLGVFSLYFAYSGLIVLASDYGTSVAALREMSLERNGIGAIFWRYFTFRTVLGFVCGLTGAIALSGAGVLMSGHFPLFLAFILAQACAGQADFALLPLRAKGLYGLEAIAALASSVSHLLIVGFAAIQIGGLPAVVVGYFVSRIFGLLIVLWVARKHVPTPATSFFLRETFYVVKAGLANGRTYAADSLLSAALSYVDVIMVAHLLDARAAGLYQVGAKVMQTSLYAVQIASAIYVPALARALDTDAAGPLFRRMTLELVLAGLAISLCMLFVMPQVVVPLFGSAFADTNILWPGLAAAVIVRCIAASFGIVMIACGAPHVRVISGFLILSTFIILSAVLVPVYGLAACGWVLAAALGFSLVFYASFIVTRYRGRADFGNLRASRALS